MASNGISVRDKIYQIIKYSLLYAYVYLYAKVRNRIMKAMGTSHLCVLVYHRVSDQYRDAVTVGREQFIAQMRMLKKEYEIISAEDLVHVYGKPMRRPTVLVTFDDGYQDNYHAAKILQELDIKAIFFVTTRFVDTQRALAHDIQKLGKAIPMLSWAEVAHMASWGHSIGNHSAEHKNLAQINYDSAIEQVVRGQKDLIRHLGDAASPELLAYPFGRREDLAENVRLRIADLGIQFCFSAYGGVNRGRFNVHDIRRQGIDYAFNELAFRAAVEGWETRIPPRKQANGP